MRKNKFLTFLFVGALLVWGPVSLQAMDKEADTIDELVSMFDESTCIDCHDEIHDQWSTSWHAQSVVSSLGSIYNFIEIGIKKDDVRSRCLAVSGSRTVYGLPVSG